MSCQSVKYSRSCKDLGCLTGCTWLAVFVVFVEQGYDLIIWEMEVIIKELLVMSGIVCKDDGMDGHVNC